MTHFKCFAVFILMFECCLTEEPNEKRCVGASELSFFTKTHKTKSEAIKACRNYQNSNLVKVDSLDITTAIDSVIKVNKIECYIGGTPDGDRNWIWPDGTKIYLPSENDGYQNWEPGQPNDVENGEDCIIVGRRTKKWHDSSCFEKLGYICQKDADPCITVHSSTRNIHECIATGSSPPQVEWRKENTQVTTISNTTIFQTKTIERSDLYFENATIGDAGNYICAAWVGVGVKNYSKPVVLKVNGTPVIINIKSFPCNSSLHVLWKPKRTALNFWHRIIVSDSSRQVFNVTTVPTGDNQRITEITGLQPSTKYSIKISACPKNDICTTIDYATTEIATTNGAIETVTNASLVQWNEKKTCNVTWDWPYDATENTGAQFKIILEHGSTFNNVTYFINSTQGEYLYSFEPLQDRSYKVKVQSTMSVELCDLVEATGSCIGKTESSSLIAIIIPVLAAGVVIILIIVIILFVRKKRDNKSKKENTTAVRGNTTNPSASIDNNIDAYEMSPMQNHEYAAVEREEIQNNLYSMATKVPAAPSSVPVYAAVNKNQVDRRQEYSNLKTQNSSYNDAYDSLHSHKQQNVALPSTSAAVYSALNAANEEYSSISRHGPGTSTYDTLHAGQNTETASSYRQEPEADSMAVYSMVNKK